MGNASKLIELAKKKFGELTEADKKLFTAVANGEVADFSSKIEEENNPAEADKWGEKRLLSADRLEWLCTDKLVISEVSRRGIQVTGIRIMEQLNLSFLAIPFPLAFARCNFTHFLMLRNSELFTLNLTGSYVKGILANGMSTKKGLYLRCGFAAEENIDLKMAHIADTLDCQGAIFGLCRDIKTCSSDTGGIAATFDADGITVDGPVFFHEGSTVFGGVRFVGAKIGSQFVCTDSDFLNASKDALCLSSASIEGQLNLTNVTIEGILNLASANIRGNLELEKGIFKNPDGFSIIGDFVNVSKNVYLRGEARPEGGVDFTGAKIGGALVLKNISNNSKYALKLKFAHCMILSDEESSWPEYDRLILNGFIYDIIDRDAPQSVEKRLKWLQLQKDDVFSLQPYRQVAKMFNNDGRKEDAEKILTAMNWDERRVVKRSKRSKFKALLFGGLLGFGYKPLRILWLGLLLLLLGTGLFELACCKGQIYPTKLNEYNQVNLQKNAQINIEYPRFYSLVYSADLFIPLIDLHQARYYAPKNNLFFQSCMWIQILLGWVITTLLIVGLTGKLRS